MPKLEFSCLVFLVFIIPLSSQLDCELCYDGRVDASFAYKDQLIVFKGKAVYAYRVQESDEEGPPVPLDIEKLDTSVYRRLLDNKTFDLEFQFKISFSELCSSGLGDLQFDYIQTAFFDEPNRKVMLIESEYILKDIDFFGFSGFY